MLLRDGETAPIVVEDVFEPIVERGLWERVQEGFANPTRSRKRTGKASIFSGMVFCDTCNRRISFVPERAEKIYVGDVRKVNGEKAQSIEIHYRFIGSLPDRAGK